MPDQTRNLNSVTDFAGTLDSNDRIIMTDNKASLKALTTAILGKAMIEGYTGSSLAGSSQSVKSAIDNLNSNINNPTITTINDLNTYLSNVSSAARSLLFLNGTITNTLVERNASAIATVAKMDNTTADMSLYSLGGNYIGIIRYNFSTSTVTKKIEAAQKSDVEALNSNLQVKTWTPHLYDYTTKKSELSSQWYFKIGGLYVMILSISNCDYSGIDTMIQFRNLPCAVCVGGTIYFGGLKNSSLIAGKGYTIQGSANYAYPRLNVISSDFDNPVSSGATSAVFFGM